MTAPHSPDDRIDRLRASDQEAFTEIFHELYPLLVRYAQGFVGDQASDLVQEAFVRLWRGRQGLDADSSLRAYLYTVVRNMALNQERDTRRRKELLNDQPAPASSQLPDEQTVAGDFQDRMQAWIRELPDRRREAFRLSRFSGLTYDEIAHVMQVSPRTVETHIRLALEQLRDRIRQYEPDLL